MIDIIKDTLIDSIKLIPFLLLAFLIIELVEHKLNNKSQKIITNNQKWGPLLGALLGSFPQCGFSVLATNLYITRIISLGTLIAIYLSTSDEMLPILLSKKVAVNTIFQIILIKIIIGIVAGFLIDLVLRKNKNNTPEKHYDICIEDNCECEKGLLHSVTIHTTKTTLFILLTTFIVNLLFTYIPSDKISKMFLQNNIFSPLLASLIGLIPSCGASILLCELYTNNILSFSSLIAGLLTGSGVAILILLRQNKNIKENTKIIITLYLIGVFSGIILGFF